MNYIENNGLYYRNHHGGHNHGGHNHNGGHHHHGGHNHYDPPSSSRRRMGLGCGSSWEADFFPEALQEEC